MHLSLLASSSSSPTNERINYLIAIVSLVSDSLRRVNQTLDVRELVRLQLPQSGMLPRLISRGYAYHRFTILTDHDSSAILLKLKAHQGAVHGFLKEVVRQGFVFIEGACCVVNLMSFIQRVLDWLRGLRRQE